LLRLFRVFVKAVQYTKDRYEGYFWPLCRRGVVNKSVYYKRFDFLRFRPEL
jgi:hypothetical protein